MVSFSFVRRNSDVIVTYFIDDRYFIAAILITASSVGTILGCIVRRKIRREIENELRDFLRDKLLENEIEAEVERRVEIEIQRFLKSYWKARIQYLARYFLRPYFLAKACYKKSNAIRKNLIRRLRGGERLARALQRCLKDEGVYIVELSPLYKFLWAYVFKQAKRILMVLSIRHILTAILTVDRSYQIKADFYFFKLLARFYYEPGEMAFETAGLLTTPLGVVKYRSYALALATSAVIAGFFSYLNAIMAAGSPLLIALGVLSGSSIGLIFLVLAAPLLQREVCREFFHKIEPDEEDNKYYLKPNRSNKPTVYVYSETAENLRIPKLGFYNNHLKCDENTPLGISDVCYENYQYADMITNGKINPNYAKNWQVSQDKRKKEAELFKSLLGDSDVFEDNTFNHQTDLDTPIILDQQGGFYFVPDSSDSEKATVLDVLSDLPTSLGFPKSENSVSFPQDKVLEELKAIEDMDNLDFRFDPMDTNLNSEPVQEVCPVQDLVDHEMCPIEERLSSNEKIQEKYLRYKSQNPNFASADDRDEILKKMQESAQRKAKLRRNRIKKLTDFIEKEDLNEISLGIKTKISYGWEQVEPNIDSLLAKDKKRLRNVLPPLETDLKNFMGSNPDKNLYESDGLE